MSEPAGHIRVLIADDHELVRRGLVRVIRQSHPEWEVVGEAANGTEAIALGKTLRPDVAILDLSMPQANGLEVTESLLPAVEGIKVIILTLHTAMPVLRKLRRAGASALLAKNEAPRTLVTAMERVLAGEAFFASDSASRAIVDLEPPERIPVQYLLTPRELEVLRLLARGLINKEIADQMALSVRTVEIHRANIMERLGVSSLGDLVRLAIDDGIA